MQMGTASMASSRTFIGRRGLPEKVYSDNATNFVGTSKVLNELHQAYQRDQDRLKAYAARQGVEWCFIPPRAPHFGGLWEAAVKSAKQRLVRGVGNAKLTADELCTHLVEVEALLNSRPIASPGNDPSCRPNQITTTDAAGDAVSAQAAVLAGLVQGLPGQPAEASPVGYQRARLGHWLSSARPRGQHTATEVDHRTSGGRNQGRRWESARRRGANTRGRN
ncbi:uncharacterized protein LOC117191031 [Drosophila miranda]|uniref:uncharacterized protein LOC117191031 n=1 Tax=Drosophila miranda TaxID=7229 RepID=UPI00143F6FB8|nr:uncharacterized protein LOC117191031 [Drosophila miranda]